MHAWFVPSARIEDAVTGRKVSAMLTHENVHNNPRPARPLPTRPAPLPRPTSPRAVDARIDPAFGRETPIHVGSITFPADGCGELTYSTNTATMTFVVDVRFVGEWSATPAA